MKRVGFVKRIMGRGTFCFIRAVDGEEYFAHSRDFEDTEAMKVGQYVEFAPVNVRVQGKNPAATNVIAISEVIDRAEVSR